MTRRAGVLGAPVGHSLSPVLHRAAYAQLGLTGWEYTAHEVEPADLAGFLAGLDPSWAGLSLTMPLKAAVLALLDAASPTVARTGAANTVLLRAGQRLGDNTDAPGMRAALVARGVDRVGLAAVLGGGATARSAVAALTGVAARLRAYARGPDRTAGLSAAAAGQVPLEVRPWDHAVEALRAPLVVSTVVAGATDHLVAAVPARPGLLFEVVYDPWPTPLAAAWSAGGGAVVDGLELLVQQAARQVVLMTGAPVSPAELVPALRAAGERALRRAGH